MTDPRRMTDPLVLALAAGIREIAARRAAGELPPPTPLGAARLRIVRAVDGRGQATATEPSDGSAIERSRSQTRSAGETTGGPRTLPEAGAS
jgi:hypothetical protein